VILSTIQNITKNLICAKTPTDSSFGTVSKHHLCYFSNISKITRPCLGSMITRSVTGIYCTYLSTLSHKRLSEEKGITMVNPFAISHRIVFVIETKPSPPTPLRLSFYISAWNFRPTIRTRILPVDTDTSAQTFKMKHVPARQYFHVVVLIEIILTYCANLLSC
jgi:hypothetical protein